MNVNYDLINGVSWLRGENKRILKYKRAQIWKKTNLSIFVIVHKFLVIRDPDLFLAKILIDIRYDFINGVDLS